MKRKLTFGAAIVLVLAAAATGIAIAAGGDDEEPLTGRTLTQASAAALRHTGGGTVTETEVGDDGAAYEVEVRLDADFDVLGQEADDDGAADEEDEAGDD